MLFFALMSHFWKGGKWVTIELFCTERIWWRQKQLVKHKIHLRQNKNLQQNRHSSDLGVPFSHKKNFNKNEFLLNFAEKQGVCILYRRMDIREDFESLQAYIYPLY